MPLVPVVWLLGDALEASVGVPSAGLLFAFAGLAALAQLATALLLMLERLLQPGHFGAQGVIGSLHFVK